jgi:Peptidase family S41
MQFAGAVTSGNAAAPAEALISAADLRADFEQMYRELQEAHFNLYAFTSKQEMDRRFEQMRGQIKQPSTRFEAKLRFELFAAGARMGHTRIESPAAEWRAFLKGGGKGFPLQVRIVDERVYIAENLSGLNSLQPGAEIIRMMGLPMHRWLDRTERHVSAETRYLAHSIMEYDFAIYLWAEVGPVESFDITVRDADARIRRMRLPARTAAEMDAAREDRPARLDLEKPLREAKVLDGGVAYLRPGPFYNADAKTGAEEWDVSGFSAFVDNAFEEFLRLGSDRLIIDLRGNPGGDNLFSDVMVSWFATRPFRFASQFKVKVSEQSIAANAARIAHDAEAAGPVSREYGQLYAQSRIGEVVDFPIPEALPRAHRFSGRVYVLIDRQSYSNAVAVAALVQDYGFGVIVGEATSDMATTYGAMEQFSLAHTGLLVGYPKARIVRPNGDLRSRGVTPDIAIPIPIIQPPEDPVLQRARAIALR